MRIITPEIYITNTPLTSSQEKQLLASLNAMSAFVAPLLDPTKLPVSTYLPLYTDLHQFIGAVHMEMSSVNNVVNIHPMLLERNRLQFSQATELAILYCLTHNYIPTAHVLDDPKFKYMHDFLASLGLRYRPRTGWRVYSLETDVWHPKSFSSYAVHVR